MCRVFPSPSLDAGLQRARGFQTGLENGLAALTADDLSRIPPEDIAEARRLVKELVEFAEHAVANPVAPGATADGQWWLHTRGRTPVLRELVDQLGPKHTNNIPLYSLDPDAPPERRALELQWAGGPAVKGRAGHQITNAL